MTRKYFGTDGIRGTVGQSPITPDFVLRLAHKVVPPHVDYSLTDLGMEAAAHVVALSAWIEAKLPEILSQSGNRSDFRGESSSGSVCL